LTLLLLKKKLLDIFIDAGANPFAYEPNDELLTSVEVLTRMNQHILLENFFSRPDKPDVLTLQKQFKKDIILQANFKENHWLRTIELLIEQGFNKNNDIFQYSKVCEHINQLLGLEFNINEKCSSGLHVLEYVNINENYLNPYKQSFLALTTFGMECLKGFDALRRTFPLNNLEKTKWTLNFLDMTGFEIEDNHCILDPVVENIERIFNKELTLRPDKKQIEHHLFCHESFSHIVELISPLLEHDDNKQLLKKDIVRFAILSLIHENGMLEGQMLFEAVGVDFENPDFELLDECVQSPHSEVFQMKKTALAIECVRQNYFDNQNIMKQKWQPWLEKNPEKFYQLVLDIVSDKKNPYKIDVLRLINTETLDVFIENNLNPWEWFFSSLYAKGVTLSVKNCGGTGLLENTNFSIIDNDYYLIDQISEKLLQSEVPISIDIWNKWKFLMEPNDNNNVYLAPGAISRWAELCIFKNDMTNSLHAQSVCKKARL